ncbi:MAG: hypothetical protein R6W73_01985 [Candidatus Saliniplasma sp.]
MAVVKFYYPGKKFPSLSVTGDRCSRMCKHCEGHFLNSMIDVSTPEKLNNIGKKLSSKGANGFLLSGGFDKEGKVPLDGYYDVLEKIKRNTDLLINVHTGLLNENMAAGLKKAKVDMISYDMIGSQETIKEVYNLDASPSDFERGYRLIEQAGLIAVPHITLGLHGGKLKGEYRALDAVKDSEKIIINSLIPTFWGDPVQKQDILDFIETAIEITDSELVIGCMRERGRYDLETEAIKKGIQGIVLPTKKTREWVKERYEVIEKNVCCSF